MNPSDLDPHLQLGGRIIGDTHILPVRIYYEDTDFTGIVYHANYLRYLERGRSDFLRLAGVSYVDMAAREEGLAFAVRRFELGFRKPARIDDLLQVETRYESVTGARIIGRQKVLRGSELLLEARVEAACISMSGRPRRIPADLMKILAPYVAGAADN